MTSFARNRGDMISVAFSCDAHVEESCYRRAERMNRLVVTLSVVITVVTVVNVVISIVR